MADGNDRWMFGKTTARKPENSSKAFALFRNNNINKPSRRDLSCETMLFGRALLARN